MSLIRSLSSNPYSSSIEIGREGINMTKNLNKERERDLSDAVD